MALLPVSAANAQETPEEVAGNAFFKGQDTNITTVETPKLDSLSERLVFDDVQHSEGPKLGVSFDIGMKNQYNASGFMVTRNPVIQGSLTFTHDNLPGWYAFGWGSANPRNTASNLFTEVDPGVGKSFNIIDGLDGSLEAAYFSFKLSDEVQIPDATNLSASVNTTSLPLDFGFKLSQILGKDSGNGQQYTLSAGKGFKLIDGVSASVGVDAVANSKYFTDARGLAFLVGSVGVDVDIGDGWNLNVGYSPQFPMDRGTFGGTFERTGTFGFSISK